MKRYRLDPERPRQLTEDEARRLARARIDYSDIPPLGAAFFSRAGNVARAAKQPVTVWTASDVLSWLKNDSKGYYTRINHISRAAVDSQSPGRAVTPRKIRSGAAGSRSQPKP